MKKLKFLLLLLLLGVASNIITMDKPSALKISQARYNPFGKLANQNMPELTEDQLLAVIKRGDYDALQQELARGLNVHYIFENGEFKGKSLIQVVFATSIANRNEIAARLLKQGANPHDLNEFIKVAVKAFNADTVKWLLEHGAKDDKAYEVVALIAPSAQGLKKENLLKIKELLAPKKDASSAQIIKKPMPSPAMNVQVPVAQLKKQSENKDLYTVLGQSEEKKLFNALLSGDPKKVAEYLDMGVSPNFVFTDGSAGKTLLQVAVTESLQNQKEIADLLLNYGADSKGLQNGLILAIERLDKPKVAWLMARGALVDVSILNKVKELLKKEVNVVKQQKLTQIKQILEERPLAQIMQNPSKQVLPVVAKPQFNKQLPPIPTKKDGRSG